MLFSIPTQIGYGALFGLIFAESAGAPVPGETALLGAGVLAGTGHLLLPAVIAVGAGAAILGDNLGYWLGRRGGRSVLLRGGWLAGHRRIALAKGEAFFSRHGGKTVFLGRWVPGVRVVAAVLAGASAMPWRHFLLYNAAGAVAWAASVAGVAAAFGPAGAATWVTVSFSGAVLAAARASPQAPAGNRRRVTIGVRRVAGEALARSRIDTAACCPACTEPGSAARTLRAARMTASAGCRPRRLQP